MRFPPGAGSVLAVVSVIAIIPLLGFCRTPHVDADHLIDAVLVATSIATNETGGKPGGLRVRGWMQIEGWQSTSDRDHPPPHRQ